jgi:hypothetical protein
MHRSLCVFFALFLLALPITLARATPIQWTIESGGSGHYYEVFSAPGGISWVDAQADAVSRGGYLATITSSAENDFVFDLVDVSTYWIVGSINQLGPWLGGFQPPASPEPDGNWQWVTGETWAYTNWTPGAPNDSGGQGFNEQYLRYYSDDNGLRQRFWDDAGDPQHVASLMQGYVVETVPEPSTLMLASAGLSGLLVIARRRARGRRK